MKNGGGRNFRVDLLRNSVREGNHDAGFDQFRRAQAFAGVIRLDAPRSSSAPNGPSFQFISPFQIVGRRCRGSVLGMDARPLK